MKAGTGTIVDAPIIGAPSPTKNADNKQDPEMHQTRKGQQWYFGMKIHIGVDSHTGLTHSARGEHVFAVVKRLWGFTKVRYRGLTKNAIRLFVALALANIYLARGCLMA